MTRHYSTRDFFRQMPNAPFAAWNWNYPPDAQQDDPEDYPQQAVSQLLSCRREIWRTIGGRRGEEGGGMDPNYTDITLLLDRTGSMESVKDETINAVNLFITEQAKVPGQCTFTLVQFDSENPFEVLCSGVPIAQAKRLTPEVYQPRALTPLWDAIGMGIEETGKRLEAMAEAERPGKVLFVVMTDGLNNASRKFTPSELRKMIEHQKNVYRWEFVFLGANMDACMVGEQMGIPQATSLTVDHSGAGYEAAIVALSSNTAAYRTGQSTNMNWTAEQRQEQENIASS
jgi:hypothetical protein